MLEYEHLLINKKSNCLIKPIVRNYGIFHNGGRGALQRCHDTLVEAVNEGMVSFIIIGILIDM